MRVFANFRRIAAAVTARWPHKGVPVARRETGTEGANSGKLIVVLPCYRAADFLPDILQDLVNQTLSRQQFRVLAVLNGPEDGSREILEGFRSQLPLEILTSPVANAGAARNVALDYVEHHDMSVQLAHRQHQPHAEVSGGVNGSLPTSSTNAGQHHVYVSFVDVDDRLDADHLECLLATAGPTRVAIAPQFYGDEPSPYSTRAIAMSQYCEYPLWQQSWVLAFTPSKAIPAHCAVLYRFDEDLTSGEDVVYLCQFLRHRDLRVASTGERGAYRRHLRDGSVSRQEATYEFLVEQRQAVIDRLRRIPVKGWARVAINDRIVGQMSLQRQWRGIRYAAADADQINSKL